MPRAPRKTPNAVEPPAGLLDGIFPNKPIAFDRFQRIADWYSLGTPEELSEKLSGVCLYVWRKFPKVDTKSDTLDASYIERLDGIVESSPVPFPTDIKEWIIARHGGGGFSFSLNDKKREKNQVAGSTLKIDEVEFPPIITPAQLVTSDGPTMNWAMRQVSLGRFIKNSDGSFMLKEAHAAARADGTSEATLARIAEKATQGNPLADGYKQAMDLQQETFKNLLAMGNKGDSGTGQALTVLIGMLQSTQAQNTQLILKMMDQKAAPPAAPAPAASPTSSLKEAIEAVVALQEIMPKAAAEAPWWLELGKSLGPALLPLAMSLIPKGGPPGGTPGIVPAAPAPTETPRGPDVRAIFAERAERCMNSGIDGGDFAQTLDVMMGPEYYDALRKQGKDNLTALLLQSAQAATFTADGAKTQEFLQEFLDYGNPDEGQQEGATA